MDKLAVQSRYTRINSWYRAPRLVRFSDRLVRQMTRSGREFVRHQDRQSRLDELQVAPRFLTSL
jgi:hypothetical protein